MFLALVAMNCLPVSYWNQQVCGVQLERWCVGSRPDGVLVMVVTDCGSKMDDQGFFVAGFAMWSSFGSKSGVALRKRRSRDKRLEMVKTVEEEERVEYTS